MTAKNIEQEVRALIAEQLGLDLEFVRLESLITDDLDADSLDEVELIIAFEEKYEIEIPDEDAEKCRTVGDVVRYLESRNVA